jgi:hypothetical protein
MYKFYWKVHFWIVRKRQKSKPVLPIGLILNFLQFFFIFWRQDICFNTGSMEPFESTFCEPLTQATCWIGYAQLELAIKPTSLSLPYNIILSLLNFSNDLKNFNCQSFLIFYFLYQFSTFGCFFKNPTRVDYKFIL